MVSVPGWVGSKAKQHSERVQDRGQLLIPWQPDTVSDLPLPTATLSMDEPPDECSALDLITFHTRENLGEHF